MPKHFPVYRRTQHDMDMGLRVKIEGMPFGFSGAIQTSPFTNGQTLGNFAMPASHIAYLTSASLTSDSETACSVQFGFSEPWSYAGTSYYNWRGYVSKYVSLSIVVNQVANANGSLVWSSKEDFAPVTPAHMFCTVQGGMITDDLYFDADLVYLSLGDSVTVGSAGLFNTFNSNDLFPWKIRDYYRSQGKSIRIINKGLGGKNSTDLETYRTLKRGVDVYADLVTYNMGINDVAGGVFDETKYRANVAAMINHTGQINPKRKFVLLGPSPVYEIGRHGRLETLRAAAQNIVSVMNDPLVTYANMGNAFDRTDVNKYSVTEVDGDKVHPNVSGHQDMFNVIKDLLPTLN